MGGVFSKGKLRSAARDGHVDAGQPQRHLAILVLMTPLYHHPMGAAARLTDLVILPAFLLTCDTRVSIHSFAHSFNKNTLST
jgi:hypothetical protein